MILLFYQNGFRFRHLVVVTVVLDLFLEFGNDFVCSFGVCLECGLCIFRLI